MGYPEPMIVLEYEKLYHGFLLISKKRYAGDKVEPGKPAKITVMDSILSGATSPNCCAIRTRTS